uniref:Homeotic protein spalt-major n=1 Tax=Parasacculina yatsui TaxID=2836420 RepID=A0A8K1RF33_9CRUS|nr:spalt-like protein [Parasacculina yatsui]
MSRRKQARPIRHQDADGLPVELSKESESLISADGGALAQLSEDSGADRESPFSDSSNSEEDSAASPVASGANSFQNGGQPGSDNIRKMSDLQNSLIHSLGSLLNMSGTQTTATGNGEEKDADPVPGTVESSAVPSPQPQHGGLALYQLMSAAMGQTPGASPGLQDLSLLTSSVYSLQQRQQMMQLKVLKQMQEQIRKAHPLQNPVHQSRLHDSTSSDNILAEAEVTEMNKKNLIDQLNTENTSNHEDSSRSSNSSSPDNSDSKQESNSAEITKSPARESTPMPNSLASAVIQPNDDDTPIASSNSLEMLQKTTQQVLSNASQGLLANNMVDELYQRDKAGSASAERKEESFFKHRCRYCGKVFGSDSALQIHIRSHTGERPYKCNVCGNRFTTKGNLKVHFQRHRDRFPHVKMNPNMVPEHLDKYYPPLLAQLGELPDTPQPPVPPPHFGSPLLGPPALYSRALNDDAPVGDKDEMSKSKSFNELIIPTSTPMLKDISIDKSPLFGSSVIDKDAIDLTKLENDKIPTFTPIKLKRPSEGESDQGKMKKHCITNIKSLNSSDGSLDLKTEHVSVTDTESVHSIEPENNKEEQNTSGVSSADVEKSENEDSARESSPERPQNLSKSIGSPIFVPSSIGGISSLGSQRMPPSFPFGLPVTTLPQPPLQFPPSLNPMINLPSGVDPCKDPIVYSNLLPKPGINDNAWEALIEVEKTSETSKLQQLVDNIENKITDPNQCVICQRVLSCKSALQMHYRTHTGERPFKCRICGRAFTTKGNLKTHMGVHRTKPPMRMSHQCPVCHKRFQNGLVLQQHIRLHTGEPTDMSPEQIAAGELLEPNLCFAPPPPLPPPPSSLLFPGGFALPPSHLAGLPPFPGLLPPFHPHHRYLQQQQQQRRQRHSSCSSPEGSGEVEEYRADGQLDFSLRQRTTATANKDYSESPRKNGSTSDNNSDCSIEGSLCNSPQEVGEATITTTSASADPPPTIISNSLHINNPSDTETNSDRLSSNSPSLKFRHSPHLPLDLTPRSSAAIPSEAAVTSPCAKEVPTSSSLVAASSLLPPPLASLQSTMFQSPSLFSAPPFVFGASGLSALTFSALRGNTTCSICFKVFACQSALDIHYRSHTKERPFKCNECDKAFSTKGNLKQHMMTHRAGSGPLSPSSNSTESNVPTSMPADEEGTVESSSRFTNGFLQFGRDDETSDDNECLDMTSKKLAGVKNGISLAGDVEPAMRDVISPYVRQSPLIVTDAP